MEKILFVFELDGTLMECKGTKHDELTAPLKLTDHVVTDSKGKKCRLYPEVKDILKKISAANYSIAFASRTQNPDQTREILRMFGIDKYADVTAFNYLTKAEQIEFLSAQTEITHDKILFFDADRSHTEEINLLGVKTYLIPDEGLTMDTFIVSMKNASLSFDLERLKITWGLG
ncbi:MAG: magnesium-dependent phosphatase-1 [Bacteroidales bacterium]|nr:magnesium-dependent phosphatase-1 [Bacteroidales bacterium]